jgi:hypothetical protein
MPAIYRGMIDLAFIEAREWMERQAVRQQGMTDVGVS